MKKEQKKLFERTEINTRSDAERILAKRDLQTKLGLAGIGVAAVTSVYSLIRFVNVGPEHFFDKIGISLIGALIAYILCGGIGKAIRCMFNTGSVFWNLIPFYPVCLISYVIGLMVGFGILIGLPIVFTLGSFLAKKQEFDDALMFMNGNVATY